MYTTYTVANMSFAYCRKRALRPVSIMYLTMSHAELEYEKFTQCERVHKIYIHTYIVFFVRWLIYSSSSSFCSIGKGSWRFFFSFGLFVIISLAGSLCYVPRRVNVGACSDHDRPRRICHFTI